MFGMDPFAIGPAQELTEKQKAKQRLDAEWEAAGKPTLEERIAGRNGYISDAIKRAFGEK